MDDTPCPYRLLIGAHLAGELDRQEGWRFRRHLWRCARCRRELVELRPVDRLLRRALLPPSVLDRWNERGGR